MKGDEDANKYGEGAGRRRIRLKLLQLIYDFALNDDSIVDNGFFIRDTLIKDPHFIDVLLDEIQQSDVARIPESVLREYGLYILFRLYQRMK